jgi:hypothetical protein
MGPVLPASHASVSAQSGESKFSLTRHAESTDERRRAVELALAVAKEGLVHAPGRGQGYTFSPDAMKETHQHKEKKKKRKRRKRRRRRRRRNTL